MSEWNEVLLSEVADIQQGYAFKSEDFGDTLGIPVIKIKNISTGKVNLTDTQYYNGSSVGLSKYMVQNGDILIAMTGSHLDQPSSVVGRVSRYKESKVCILNQRTAKIIPKQDTIDPTFLYYTLTLRDTLHILAGNASGSANQANISSAQIYSLQLPFPPLSEQKAIAEILGSLDDKIDLLHRNNKTLQALAEVIFENWFDKECDMGTLSKFGQIICGKTPSKKERHYFNGEIPFLKIPDMHGRTFVFRTDDSLTLQGMQSQSNKTIPMFSISVSCIATVGLVTMNAVKCQTNQQINSIIPHNEQDRYFLFNYLKSIKQDLIQRASSGSVTHNLNTTDFANTLVPLYSSETMMRFHDIIKPFYDKIFSNESQILVLESLRDSMLPKLVNGSLKIHELITL